MNAGVLDTRLSFEELAKTEPNQTSGVREEKWIHRFTVWGSRRYVSAVEASASGGRLVATSEVLFEIRHRDDVDAKMRIVISGERAPYYIVGIPERRGRNRTLVIRCTQRAD